MPKRLSPQQQIAYLMESDGSNLGQDPNAGPDYAPSDPPGTNARTDDDNCSTEMRQCMADSCTHNVHGQSCGLESIEISQDGSCSDYEPRDDQQQDESAIINISALMPADLDSPTQLFDPGEMF